MYSQFFCLVFVILRRKDVSESFSFSLSSCISTPTIIFLLCSFSPSFCSCVVDESMSIKMESIFPSLNMFLSAEKIRNTYLLDTKRLYISTFDAIQFSSKYLGYTQSSDHSLQKIASNEGIYSKLKS